MDGRCLAQPKGVMFAKFQIKFVSEAAQLLRGIRESRDARAVTDLLITALDGCDRVDEVDVMSVTQKSILCCHSCSSVTGAVVSVCFRLVRDPTSYIDFESDYTVDVCLPKDGAEHGPPSMLDIQEPFDGTDHVPICATCLPPKQKSVYERLANERQVSIQEVMEEDEEEEKYTVSLHKKNVRAIEDCYEDFEAYLRRFE